MKVKLSFDTLVQCTASRVLGGGILGEVFVGALVRTPVTTILLILITS